MYFNWQPSLLSRRARHLQLEGAGLKRERVDHGATIILIASDVDVEEQTHPFPAILKSSFAEMHDAG